MGTFRTRDGAVNLAAMMGWDRFLEAIDGVEIDDDPRFASIASCSSARFVLRSFQSQKRDPAWLSRWLQFPDRMLAEKDPLAMQLYTKYREVPMPNLGLNDVDVQALVDYMQRESRQVEQANASDGVGAQAKPHH